MFRVDILGFPPPSFQMVLIGGLTDLGWLLWSRDTYSRSFPLFVTVVTMEMELIWIALAP